MRLRNRIAGRSDATRSLPERRAALRGAFEACRERTLVLYRDVDDALFRRQAHPEFSPIGWHLGHIAYVEATWLVRQCGGEPLPFPELEYTFDVEGLPKAERTGVPPKDEVLAYAEKVRAQMLECLERADLDEQEPIWRFVLQHECQHGETVTFVKYLLGLDGRRPSYDAGMAEDLEWCRIDAGTARIGHDGPDAMDNEGPAHEVDLPAFEITRHPVTQAQFRGFMEAGGYLDPSLWSEAGWAWRSANGITAPLYWAKGLDRGPVFGVSAHEAEAFARWADARLPSEFEWERAARGDSGALYPWGDALPLPEYANLDGRLAGTAPVNAHSAGVSAHGVEDMIGNVWEWTASAFRAYPDFSWFPYRGYSEVYFDGEHRVLRGGSWATRPWAIRASFRNWYQPHIRQILAGFRLARSAEA